jgi:hypothetical protein
MPSSRVPKSYSVTASGAKRPLRGSKNDVRLAADEREGIPSGSRGGTSEGGTSYYTGRGYRTTSKTSPDAFSKKIKKTTTRSTWASISAPTKTSSHTSTVGSYAKNYFKKNSK